MVVWAADWNFVVVATIAPLWGEGSVTENEAEIGKAENSNRTAWHFHPDLPIRLAPFYDRPIRIGAIAKYLLGGWSLFGERIYFLLIAIGIWIFFSPSLERTVTFQFDWIFEIWLRNLILITIVAGGLHLYLYTFRKQGDDLRYDTRTYPAKGKAFLFGNQLWDNMFWSLTSGVAVWTAYESVFMWVYANGLATMITLEDHPFWFIALILLTPYWAGFYFFWQHRSLHWPPLFKHIHARHHKNVNLGPWSGLSQHPVEQIVDQSDCLIFLLIPSHPVHVIFNLLFHGIGAPSSHTGYDAVRLWGSRRLQIGDFLHQLHHRHFDCNYGTYDMPWDRVFGCFHDGTPEGDRTITERRKALRAKARRKGPR